MDGLDARDYLEPAALRDGGSVLIRAIRPSDARHLHEAFERLSERSRRFRFFGLKKDLSSVELAYLTELDFERHVALVALLKDGGEERIIGVARYVRTHDESRARAELAITVADDQQGRGLGTLLLEHLARLARAQGIEEFEAEVLTENGAMMDVFSASGFAVTKTIESGVFHVLFPIRESERFVAASTERERRSVAESVRVFFEPRSVAVIGASRREGSIGRAIVANLVRCGYRGGIHPVNPEAAEIEGLRAHPKVGAIEAPVDLAVIAVPARLVEGVVAECAAAGVKGVVVISAGFAETSTEGRQMQANLRGLVRSAGMRMVGPNCMGVLNADPDVALNATFAPIWPPSGNVSILSQSGALGLAMLDHADKLNIGIAGFVSVGNKADVSGNDLLSFWGDDPRTGVIALYLESFGNPRKFARIAPAVARKKPIVAVKSGRSAAGTRAASSHSAALASLDVGVDALFAQAGVIRTATLEELFDVVALLSTQPVPRGSRIGVVTNAGGPGILLADACEAHGLELPQLEASTLDELRRFLPAEAGLSNPIDMIASAKPEDYAKAIALVGTDSNVDAVVVIYIPPLVTRPEEVARAIAEAAAHIPLHKPIATVFMSSKGAPPILSKGPRGRIPSYSFPENAAIALSAAVRYGQWRDRRRGSVRVLDRDKERAIRKIVEDARARAIEWIAPDEVARILDLAGIPLARFERTASDPQAAAAAAKRIGYPAVLKAVAARLLHKSDLGGVALGLARGSAVRDAAREMKARLEHAGHEIEGFLVQQQIEGGVEAMVGVTTDPSLGPILVTGLGGVNVELLRDVAFRLTPVSDLEADNMLKGLRSAKLLDGYRGSAPADRAALTSLIEQVSALIEAVPELLELELNPVKVLAPGKGAIAVDARMRIAAKD
jgi:acetate---CoA ligase (ADP-forming)